MAKPLGEKSRIIREAIKKHPNRGNTELATFLNDAQDRLDDKFEFKAAEVAQQKIALKKVADRPAATQPATASVAEAETPPESAEPATTEPKRKGTKKRGRPLGRKTTVAPAAARVQPAVAPKQVNPADLLDRVFDLAAECGGIEQLRRIVERLAAR
jgi:hypothetical protein